MANKPDPQHKQLRQIDLHQIAQQFMAGLQRHFDMLSFNLAAHDLVEEDAYNNHAHAPCIMPSSPHHQNFEQLQAHAHNLLVRQVVHDSLKLAIAAMNNTHFFLALVKATDVKKQLTSEAQKAAQDSHRSFIRAQLDEKFNRLEKDYGIMCDLENSITSLGFVLQGLVQQKGIVRKAQLDEEGKLVLELKSADTGKAGFEPAIKPRKLVDVRKVYREGDGIFFSNIELQLILVTIASFADSLFKSVAKYARSVQEMSD